MSTSSRSSGSSRVRRPPPVYGNVVSSDQAYGSDDELDDFDDYEEEEDESWGREKAVKEGEEGNSDEEESEGDGSDFEDDKAKKGTEKGKAKETKAPKSKATKAPKVTKDKTTKPKAAPKEKKPAKGASKPVSGPKPKLKPLVKPNFKPSAKASKVSSAELDEEAVNDLVNFDAEAPGPSAVVKPQKSAGGKAPTIKSGKVSLAKKGGLLPVVSKAKPLVQSKISSVLKSAVKPSVKPSVKPAVKKAAPKADPLADIDLEASPAPEEVKNEEEEVKDGDEDAKNEDESGKDDDAASTDEKQPASTPAKRKRSAGSDSTPRKLVPAEKLTPDMRVGIIKLFLDPAYLGKVNFKAAATASPGQTEAKLKRHWREVLGEDAVAYARDGTVRGGRNNSKGGIESAHRLKIWEAVAKAYDGAQWGKLEEETGMTTTKLKRHFRDVLKKDIIKMINAK